MTIVSLVPSLTEAIALTPGGRERLVGVTDWCSHPSDLVAKRVGGTKNPNVAKIIGLAPDVVVANEEENRQPDLDALRAAGLRVIVTHIRSVDGALSQLRELLNHLDLAAPRWLSRAQSAWSGVTLDRPRRRCVVMIWRKPWMAVGSDTYAGDVLARLGFDNVLGADTERYPQVHLDQLPGHDLVVLPDEPYHFTADDGPGFFTAPSALVSGRLLTWYGPAMADAPRLLDAALHAALRDA